MAYLNGWAERLRSSAVGFKARCTAIILQPILIKMARSPGLGPGPEE